ncbi:MAG: ammonium transporter, partial [Gammaproteobacteria bacterium]
LLGTMMTGIFVAAGLGGAGLAEGMSIGRQLGVQFTGVAATLIWTAAATFVVLKIVDALIGLRVDEEQETEGLDLTQHEEKGYYL